MPDRKQPEEEMIYFTGTVHPGGGRVEELGKEWGA